MTRRPRCRSRGRTARRDRDLVTTPAVRLGDDLAGLGKYTRGCVGSSGTSPGTGDAGVTAFGPVVVSGGATLDARSGRSVYIGAGTLSIDASAIGADRNGPGGQIALQADSHPRPAT
jgi:hypothetical protein